MSAATITGGDLQALLGRGGAVALLDLRERGAFERGHIFRATPLPRRLLESRLPVLITCPRTPIVLCDADGSLSALAASTPVRRTGTVEDVADCVAWIVSDGAGFLTGQTILLDGGLCMVSPLARFRDEKA